MPCVYSERCCILYTAMVNLDSSDNSPFSTLFTCMITEYDGDNVTFTQRGHLCHEEQTASSIPSTDPIFPSEVATVGALVHLTPSGNKSSKTADCFPKTVLTETVTANKPSGQFKFDIHTALLAGLGSSKSRQKSFLKQRGSNILVVNRESKDSVSTETVVTGYANMEELSVQIPVDTSLTSNRSSSQRGENADQMTLPNEAFSLHNHVPNKTTVSGISNIQSGISTTEIGHNTMASGGKSIIGDIGPKMGIDIKERYKESLEQMKTRNTQEQAPNHSSKMESVSTVSRSSVSSVSDKTKHDKIHTRYKSPVSNKGLQNQKKLEVRKNLKKTKSPFAKTKKT